MKKATMKPPVSVCHQVSDIGHLESPTILKNHLVQTNKWDIGLQLLNHFKKKKGYQVTKTKTSMRWD